MGKGGPSDWLLEDRRGVHEEIPLGSGKRKVVFIRRKKECGGAGQ